MFKTWAGAFPKFFGHIHWPELRKNQYRFNNIFYIFSRHHKTYITVWKKSNIFKTTRFNHKIIDQCNINHVSTNQDNFLGQIGYKLNDYNICFQGDYNRSSHQMGSVKKGVLKNRKIHVPDSPFVIKLQASDHNFIIKETLEQVFFCEF